MKNRTHKSLKRLLLVGGFLLGAATLNSALAQPTGPPGPPGGGGQPPCWPPPCVPVDGGVSFLIAAGLAYGGKKAFDLMKK